MKIQRHLYLVSPTLFEAKQACRVRVFLTHLDERGVRVDGKTNRPYKWACECVCGWRALSWSWDRQWDQRHSNLSPEDWVRDNGEPEGGALPMALEHVKLAPEQTWLPILSH